MDLSGSVTPIMSVSFTSHVSVRALVAFPLSSLYVPIGVMSLLTF
jgi:hypothetical protein